MTTRDRRSNLEGFKIAFWLLVVVLASAKPLV